MASEAATPAAAHAWPPAERDPVISRLGAALRDPFYRCERLQARTFHPLLWLLVAVPVLVIPHLWAALPAVAVIAAAEGVIQEAGRDTWAALLLTPVDRGRILWCKLLGRLRPVLRIAAVIPVCCAAIGGCLALLVPDALQLIKESSPAAERLGPWAWGVLGAAAGLAAGAVLTLLIWGECFTAGALGLYFALRWPRRVAALVLTGTALATLHTAEILLVSAAWLAVATAFHGAMRDATTGAAVTIAFWTVVLAARTAAVNVLLPYGLLAHCACHLDRWLLRETDIPPAPRPRREPDG
jgi:hypothetical protein